MSIATPISAAERKTDLQQLATDVVERALRAGATDAEVVIREGDEFSTLVRLGQVETLKESGARGIGLRVFLGSSGSLRTASTSTSDFSEAGLAHLIAGAVDLAQVTSVDPFAGLPEAGAMGQLTGDLDLYYEDVYSLPTAQRIEYARRAEAAALSADPRIQKQKSDGGSFDAATGRKVLANSRGFTGEYRRSYCSLSAMPIAQTEQGGMQRDYWYSSARTLGRLDSPESIGAEAARRTLRRLNARRVPTQSVPIVFAPEIARSLIGNIFEAANGDSIYRGASFWAHQLGNKVASSNVTVVDDGTLIGLFGTSPFDGEGLPTRRTVIVENGVLKNYLLNTYTARKLNMQSTGSASRGLAGTPGIGAGNLFLEKGSVSPQQLLADVKAGFYVTELMGFGVNMVTGDYSRGAAGLWIENGELTYAVEEVTIAGNLKEMLNNITAIADDLEFRGSVASPTLRIDGMTIAGE
jgi:PmbA protein